MHVQTQTTQVHLSPGKGIEIAAKMVFRVFHNQHTRGKKHTHIEVISRGVSEQKACGQNDSHAGNHDDTRCRDLPLAIHGPVAGKVGRR